MILSDTDITFLIESGNLRIEPFSPEDIRESSIKLHLAPKLLKYRENIVADLKDDSTFITEEIILPVSGYIMKPDEFLLGSTLEKITIPNGYMGWIETRGSIARAGLQMHLCDAHIDPGSSMNITLQLKNNANHCVKIYPEFYMVKLYLIKMTSNSKNVYKGKFQGEMEAGHPIFNQ